MKRMILFVLFPAVVTLFMGCRQEIPIETEVDAARQRNPVFASVPVEIKGGLDDMETKSVVTVEVENFRDAYLFAFYNESKTICSYGEEGGDKEGAPVAIYTESKSFNWAVPIGEQIDVLAIVNAPESLREILDSYLLNGNLKESDLTGFMFTCSSAEELKALENGGKGMPMSSMQKVKLDDFNSTMTIKVKKLFAKYNITLDCSGYESEGWSVTAARIVAARSNTSVPYFYTGDGPGYKQTDASLLAAVDTSDEGDLLELNTRDGSFVSNPVSYYLLENCQNITEKASKWSSVASELGSLVSLCSYLTVTVYATKTGYGNRTFTYQIYLDSTADSGLRTGFNVVRNTFRSIILKLGEPQISFRWTGDRAIAVCCGRSLSGIAYESTLSPSEGDYIYFKVLDSAGQEVASSSLTKESEPMMELRAAEDAISISTSENCAEGTYTLWGGNADASDEVTLTVAAPVYYLELSASPNYQKTTANSISVGVKLIKKDPITREILSSTTLSASDVNWSWVHENCYKSSATISLSRSGNSFQPYSYGTKTSTDELIYLVKASYTTGGNTYTGSLHISWGPTHFIKFSRGIRQVGNTGRYIIYPKASEPVPLLSNGYTISVNTIISIQSGVTVYGNSYHTTIGFKPGSNMPEYTLNESEYPVLNYSDRASFQISYARFNTTGTPEELDNTAVDGTYYYLYINNSDWEESTGEDSYYSFTLYPEMYAEYVIDSEYGLWDGMFRRFTGNYTIRLYTNIEKQTDIPLLSYSGGDKITTSSGYVNIQEVIKRITVTTGSGVYYLTPTSSAISAYNKFPSDYDFDYSAGLLYPDTEPLYSYFFGGATSAVFSAGDDIDWSDVTSVKVAFTDSYANDYTIAAMLCPLPPTKK